MIWIWLHRLFELPPLAVSVCLAVAGGLWLIRRRSDAVLARAARRPGPGKQSGAEVAAELLAAAGVVEGRVTRGHGHGLDVDDLDTGSGAVVLPALVHDGVSLAATGLAAHEVGHVLQRLGRDAPQPLVLREPLRFAARLSAPTAALLFAVGLVLDIGSLQVAALVLAPVAAAAPLAALPLERDASRRGRRALAMSGLIDSGDEEELARVLDAAAWAAAGCGLPRVRSPAWPRSGG